MIVGLIVAIYFAYKFSDYAAHLILSFTEKAKTFLPLLSFILTFFIVLLAFIVLSKVMSSLIKITGLGFFNRIFGALFGGLKFAILISVLLVFVLPLEEKFEIIEKKTKKESLLFSPLIKLGLEIQPKLFFLKEQIKEKLYELDEYIPQKEDNSVIVSN